MPPDTFADGMGAALTDHVDSRQTMSANVCVNRVRAVPTARSYSRMMPPNAFADGTGAATTAHVASRQTMWPDACVNRVRAVPTADLDWSMTAMAASVI